MESKRILIVDDEKKISQMLEDFFSAKGFFCVVADNGIEAVDAQRAESCGIILLDWMMPGINGIETARRIREFSDAPIIMLTARNAEKDKVLGLESGADDYVVKPFSLKELNARVEAHLRRFNLHRTDPEEAVCGSFRINRITRQGWKDNRELSLTALRFDLLALFVENPGRAFTREQIMEHLSGDGFYEGFDRTIDAHIKNLRKLVEPEPSRPRYILTVRGIGYKFGGEQ